MKIFVIAELHLAMSPFAPHNERKMQKGTKREINQ